MLGRPASRGGLHGSGQGETPRSLQARGTALAYAVCRGALRASRTVQEFIAASGSSRLLAAFDAVAQKYSEDHRSKYSCMSRHRRA
jgi:hypothetical protein